MPNLKNLPALDGPKGFSIPAVLFCRADKSGRNNKNPRQQGFTLLELSIVLMITGIMLVAFLHFYMVWLQKERYDLTQKRLEDIRAALLHYVAAHERLPCPATPPGAAPGGDAPDNAGGCAPKAKAPDGLTVYSLAPDHPEDQSQQIWIGVIPSAELRLDGEQGRDGWGDVFTYAVSRRLTLPAAMRGNPLPPGIISVVDEAGDNILDAPDTGRYVVVSHGPSGAGAWQPGGGRKPCATNTLDSLNCNGENVFVVAAWTTAPGNGFYDDLVIHDDLNSGGSLLDRMVACSAEAKFYKPSDPTADQDGCRARSAWEGACLQTITTDTSGTRQLLAPSVVMPPALISGNACGCQPGYTTTQVGLWSGGVVQGTPVGQLACPGGGNGCLIGSPGQYKFDGGGHIIGYSSPDVPGVQTALFTCIP